MSKPLTVVEIPSDIVLLIWKQAVTEFSSGFAYKAASIVASVCKAWRFLALSTPWLWSKLLLDPLHSPSIQLRLTRSQNAPLSIVTSQFTRAMEPVLSQVHRWERLRIGYGRYQQIFETLIDYTVSPTYRPENNIITEVILQFSVAGVFYSEQSFPDSSIWPNLASLTLSNTSIAPCLRLMPPTLRSLTLDGTDINIDELRDVLQQCPNLETLDICSCSPVIHRQGPSEKLSLPVLRYLDTNSPSLVDFFVASSPILQALKIISPLKQHVIRWIEMHNLNNLTDLEITVPTKHKPAIRHAVESLLSVSIHIQTLVLSYRQSQGNKPRDCSFLLSKVGGAGICNSLQLLSLRNVAYSNAALCVVALKMGNNVTIRNPCIALVQCLRAHQFDRKCRTELIQRDSIDFYSRWVQLPAPVLQCICVTPSMVIWDPIYSSKSS